MSTSSSSDGVGPPALFVLVGRQISLKDGNSTTPMFCLNKGMDELTHKDTSIRFGRFGKEEDEPDGTERREETGEQDKTKKSESSAAANNSSPPLYYLVHPANAKYRTDVPAYYMTTGAAANLPGNIQLDLSGKHPVSRKAEFRAMLSPGKTAASGGELFDEETAQRLLFEAKSKLLGKPGYVWSNADSEEVAREEKHGDEVCLAVLKPMPMGERDAIVALWVLRLWHDIARERNFTKEALIELTPAESAYYKPPGGKNAKRAGPMGAFAALAGS